MRFILPAAVLRISILASAESYGPFQACCTIDVAVYHGVLFVRHYLMIDHLTS